MKELLATDDQNDGYCLVVGIENGELVKALAIQSEFFHIVAFDRDPEKSSGCVGN